MKQLSENTVIEITGNLDEVEIVLGKDHPVITRGVLVDLKFMVDDANASKFSLGEMADARDSDLDFYKVNKLVDLEISGFIKLS